MSLEEKRKNKQKSAYFQWEAQIHADARNRMSTSTHFTGSIWFVTLIALLVSLGSELLIGFLPYSAFSWIDGPNHQSPVVLVAGETSFWRVETLIRVVAFGLGALIACLLASSQSWNLVATLVTASLLCTVFAQLPKTAALWQQAIWTASAPFAAFVVSAIFRAWKGNV